MKSGSVRLWNNTQRATCDSITHYSKIYADNFPWG